MQWGSGAAPLLARLAHFGQKDKIGTDYYRHPEAVSILVTRLPGWQRLTPEQQDVAHQVAWLHDVLEDSPFTMTMLTALGVPQQVIKRVHLLTRCRGQSHEEYYLGIKGDPITLLVKAADIVHNTWPTRVAQLVTEDRVRLAAKYGHAKRLLGLTEADLHLAA